MLVDTSGHNCAEWKGDFYPERLSAKRMLPFYAERSPTVEINYTFYRMPTARLLDGWSEVTLEHFRFTLKAPVGLPMRHGCDNPATRRRHSVTPLRPWGSSSGG